MSKAAEAFRTIGEVADELDVPKHVLRFWEGKFPQIRPMKRGGGRRYYRPEDMELLRGIRHLLHAEGYTIKGVQKILREQGIEQVKTLMRESAGTSKQSRKAGAALTDGVIPPARKVAVRAPNAKDASPAAAVKTALNRDDIIKAVIGELEYCRAVLSGASPAQEGRAIPPPLRSSGRS